MGSIANPARFIRGVWLTGVGLALAIPGETISYTGDATGAAITTLAAIIMLVGASVTMNGWDCR